MPDLGGVSEFMAKLTEARENMHRGAREGLWTAATNALNVSNEQVPHEEGDLERDGTASVDDDRLLAAISYGRTAQTRPYAVVQHEDLQLHHDAGRNAKFLENAINSTRQQSGEIIAAATKRRMGT